jgi:peptide/nickel transport system substrate-binding protein
MNRARALGALLLSAGLLAACGSSGDPEPTEAAGPETAQTLAVSIRTDEGTLTPYTYVTGSPGWNLLNLVYDTLLGLDAQSKPAPLLATEYASNADGTSWELTLRDGVTWHDGQPFTGQDVAFTIDYFQKNVSSRFTPQVADVTDVQVDGNTVTISLARPNPDFPNRPLADMPIIPEHIWSGISDPKTATIEQAVGTGPYRVTAYQRDRSYRLEAFGDYAMGTPRVQTLNLPIIPEAQTALSALRTNEIQAVGTGVDANLADEAGRQPDLQVAAGPLFGSSLLLLNNAVAPFDRVEVRKAIALALDTQDIVDTVRLGRAIVGSSGFVHPQSPISAGLPSISQDLAQAEALLDGIGATKGADGVRVLDGRPMAFTILTYADSPDRVRTAELVKEMLEPLGIAVTVSSQSMDAVDAAVGHPEYDPAKGRAYQMAMWGWSAATMLNASSVARLVNPAPEHDTLNVTDTDDPLLTEQSNAVFAATTPEASLEAVKTLQQGIADRVPFVTLQYPDGLYPYRPAAFDAWVFQSGQGVLQKLSLTQTTG